jgi:hypothetical protein
MVSLDPHGPHGGPRGPATSAARRTCSSASIPTGAVVARDLGSAADMFVSLDPHGGPRWRATLGSAADMFVRRPTPARGGRAARGGEQAGGPTPARGGRAAPGGEQAGGPTPARGGRAARGGEHVRRPDAHARWPSCARRRTCLAVRRSRAVRGVRRPDAPAQVAERREVANMSRGPTPPRGGRVASVCGADELANMSRGPTRTR